MGIIDASVLVALMFEEPGADQVIDQIPGQSISIVNLAEVVTRMVRDNIPESTLQEQIQDLQVNVLPFTLRDAFLAGRLFSQTVQFGLSLGDRCCLATAINRNLPVLTADRIWSKLDLGIKINLIRG